MTADIHDRPKQELTNPDAKPAKELRISRRIRSACDALVHGDVKTITDAAAKAMRRCSRH